MGECRSAPTISTSNNTESTMRNFVVFTVHLIYSGGLSRRLRWASHVARMEEGRSSFKILTGRPTEKRSLGRPRCRWEKILK